MFAGPALYIIIAAVLLGVGGAGGWSIKSWKDGAEIARLQSREAVAAQANAQCATDIDGVRKGVEAISVAVGEREKAAAAAMAGAQALAAKHSQAAKAIKDAPIQPDEPQCAAIEREQVEYVAARRGGDE